jgi:hypothetical protein
MKLTKIAQVLAKVAESQSIAKHHLQRGLRLTLQNKEGLITLSLTRRGVWTSPVEEKICRDAFGVPEDAKREHVKVRDYKIIRFIWVDETMQVQMDFLREAKESQEYF